MFLSHLSDTKSRTNGQRRMTAVYWVKGFFDKLLSSGNTSAELVKSDEIYKKLKYTFKDERILQQALKHRSYLTSSGEGRIASNERLELLGDAVLGFIITEFLYRKFPSETEGILTNYKSLLVSGRLLAEVAQTLELGQFLLLNDSEARAGGRKRNSILADAVEALIGALYLDGGIEQARKFIDDNIASRLHAVMNDDRLRNNKSLLQEYCQGLSLHGPYYRVDNESGPDHKKTFTVSVIVDGRIIGVGRGTSKKKAEQDAAGEALGKLNLL